MSQPLKPGIVLPARSRKGEVTRLPRPKYVAPAVTVDEVDIALDLIINKYKDENDVNPLAPHADTLREFVLESRQSAYAIVQIGWAMAEVENQIGDRKWFNNVWVPAMANANKDGEALPESTREGDPRRASHTERNLIVKAIGPIFVQEKDCSRWLGDLITRAVIGAYFDEKKLVWTCVGVRVSLKIVELLAGEKAMEGFKAVLKEAFKKDQEFIKGKKEEKRRAEAAAIAAGAAAPEATESDEDEDVDEAASK